MIPPGDLLDALGFDVSRRYERPEIELYRLLAAEHGTDAHGRYNALIRRLVSFEAAAECALSDRGRNRTFHACPRAARARSPYPSVDEATLSARIAGALGPQEGG